MFSLAANKILDQTWQGTLSDYITVVAWSTDGKTLAASDAAGEIILLKDRENLVYLQTANDQSVDCLAFSADGQYLAAGGQNGEVKIWRLEAEETQLITTLENAPNWVDKLAWHPQTNQLAFSMGKYVQIWDADSQKVEVTLNFESSSVLSIAWRPNGENLAISGQLGVKIWDAKNWNDDPRNLEIPVASLTLAWSGDSKFIASANLDNTLAVWQWDIPEPWLMRGFPGKIRALSWSDLLTSIGAPRLAVATAQSVVVWEKAADESIGWQGKLLDSHDGIVQAIAFQPQTFLLASAAEDGLIGIWEKAKEIVQILDGANEGFSCLAWQPQGNKLAAGGSNGEIFIWSKVSRGKGFASR
ncbi:WD40 repeat domain-containing protein [Aerosakkonemataceae cyanobacterium BLCC-F154]|uniref:WD40 repeat domain-containing protein n=1 Tax=Floridaenema fluviatile BLCC-F154 TaxID=3153640 RepID=A0ABV4YDZ5_9CYAN